MKSKIIIPIILIVLSLSIGIYFILQTPQSIIPSQCYLTEEGSTSGTYKCPTDASSCVLTLSLDCSTQVSTPKVVFRTNGNWIAWDYDSDGDLDCYSIKSNPSPSCNIPFTNKILLPQLSPIGGGKFLYGSSSTVFTKKTEVESNYCADIRYLSGTGCNTAISTQGSEYYEIISGTGDSYQCSESITGSISKVISYSGSVPGTKTETITLSPGQTISWNGQIDYEIKKVKNSECTQNVKVSSTSYYKCIIGSDGCGYIDKSQVISCGDMLFNEIIGECQVPTTCIASNGQVLNKGQAVCIDKYTLEKCSTTSPPTLSVQEVINEGDICADGMIKPAYKITTSINNLAGDSIVAETNSLLKINLAITDTSNNKRIPVSASIVGTGISKSGLTGDTSLTAGKITLELTTPNEGYYTLRITVNHPDGTYTKDYELRVTSGLTLNLYADNPIQYDNQDIQVRLDAYKSAENKRLKDWDIEAYFNSQKVTPSFTEYSGKNLIFYFDLDGDGVLRIRANGQDETELWSGWTDYTEITVKETTISINTDFKTGVCPGIIENKFTTMDSNGNLIDTQNSVLIQEPLGGKTSSVTPARISKGSYKFNYNFVEGGLYTIKVTSTSDYGVYELGDGLGEPVTILGGSACSGGGEEEKTNYLMYVIFGVIIGVIVLVIIMLRRKK